MKLLILVILLFIGPFASAQLKTQRLFYKGQNQSLVHWEELDKSWMDFRKWKLSLHYKEENPDWEVLIKNREMREVIGRGIECVGKCRLYRGVKNNDMRFRSLLLEGDEVMTEKDSYGWIFLLDGTLVRISPNSSISLREINIGINSIFFQVRINYGNILWMSRDNRPYKVDNGAESDTLFLPLDFKATRPEILPVPYSEEDLFKALKKPRNFEKHQIHLNRLISENNLYIHNKPSYSFIVMPNGTLAGYNLQAEFIVLTGRESYFKKRTPKQLGVEQHEGESDLDKSANFYFRGFENTQVSEVESGVWYKVSPEGKSIDKIPQLQNKRFWPGELLTGKITSFLMARELLLRRYSTFMFEDLIDPQIFAGVHGYRLWGRMDDVYKEDLYRRLTFLEEYTRRIETNNFLVRERFKTRLEKRGETLFEMQYSNKFFIRALKHYYKTRERGPYEADEIYLNPRQ